VSQPPVAALFSEGRALELYLRIEIALAQAEAELGLIPVKAAEEIAARARLESLNRDSLRSQTERTGYPIAPLVRQLTTICGEHGQYIHWGATTQDILNTALAIQINAALRHLDSSLLAIIRQLAALAREHRTTPMVARTFGGHALPITFGFKASVWLSGVLRLRESLASLRLRPMPGEFGGVAGTLASLEGQGLAVRARLMKLLDLPEPPITWASQRDRVVEATNILANLCGALAKIAQDISDLAATEVGELAEPVSGGKDTSSALPFKANPVYCAQVMCSASLVNQYAGTVVSAMRQHNERSGEGLLEAEAVPLAFVHAEKCLEKLLIVVRGLQVFPDRMRENLARTHGIILSERYMMALAPHVGRLRAHDLVHEACLQAVQRRQDLGDVLCRLPEVTRHLDRKTIVHLGEPMTYLGNGLEMIDAVLAAVPSELSPLEPA
jgi:3-carboxy-cis,cis-muconate cycloisomerase